MFAWLERKISYRKALVLLVVSAVLLSAGGLLIKTIDWPPLAIAGVRSAVAVLVLIAALGRRPRFTGSGEQIFGSLAFSCTMLLFITATKLTTAANAILLQYAATIYVATLGDRFLKEKTAPADWAITAAVVGGMALFFMDKLEAGHLWGNLLAVTSSFTFAAFIICMRRQKSGSPLETVILGNAITTLFGLPFMFGHSPGPAGWLLMAVMGVFQLGVAYVFYSAAIRHVPALEAALITCIEPLLNPVWVFLFVGEVPGPWTITGGIIVLTAVIAHSTAARGARHTKTRLR